MNIEEIPKGSRYAYTRKCPCCGLVQEILTQDSDSPEYEIFKWNSA